MELIFFAGGVLVGIGSSMLYKKRKYLDGIIDIDHDNNIYKIRMISKDVVDNRKIKAAFLLNHNANISREEQVL